MLKRRITARLLFAGIQSILAFSAIVLALYLHFDFLNSQSALKIPDGALNFYVVSLFIFGFIFLISGFFLFYEWWETL